MPKNADLYRIIDANFNRCKEGLRVCEDICRFHLRCRTLAARFGAARHALTRLLDSSRISRRKLIRARDTKGDSGKTSCLIPRRKTFRETFCANAQRVKESLRVLEEVFKMCDEKSSRGIQKLRFAFYDLEKTSTERFPSLLDS